MLHFKVYDRKGREGEPTAETYDEWVDPAHIVSVRAGFMKDEAATRLDEPLARIAGRDVRIAYKPDPTRTTILLTGGTKLMVEGPPQVNAVRIARAKQGLLDSDESS